MSGFDETSMVKFIVGSAQIKYDVLEDLFRTLPPVKYRMGVLFVDSHAIFDHLYREKKLTHIFVNAEKDLVRDLVVSFLNVLGHYRRFLATRLRLDNDIYAMFNRKPATYNRSNYPEYQKRLVDRYNAVDPDTVMLNRCVDRAWDFIRELSPYFEGIYCVDNSGIDDLALMYRLGMDDPEVFHCILTKNMCACQLVKENVVILRPKRDASYILRVDNCVEEGAFRDVKQKAAVGFTPDMLPLVWTLSGLKDVSMRKTKHVSDVSRAIRIANEMIEAKDLVPGTSIQSFLGKLGDHMGGRVAGQKVASDRSELMDRYRALSIPLAAAAITPDQRMGVTSQLYDLYDETELEHLNEVLATSQLDPELLDLNNLNMSQRVVYE